MMGSFLTRALLYDVIGVGYVYPAYDCYKTIEKDDVSIDQHKFWCKYWILVALFTVFESVGDSIISWLPLYGEAKVAFVLFLWHPETRGTIYVYNTFVRMYVAKHEKEMDMHLQKIRSKTVKMSTLVLHKCIIFGQSRFVEIMQYVSSQSALRVQPN